MARTLKQTKTIDGSTSSSVWTWKQVVKEYFDSLTDEIIQSKEFSNARFVRNLFERTWAKSSIRRLFDKESEISITKGDFERATADKEFVLVQQNKKNRIGF